MTRCRKMMRNLAFPISFVLLLPVQDADAFEVKAQLQRGRIAIPVYLNDVGPYPFLLDAGITRPVIDSTVATYVGLDHLGAIEEDAAATQVARFRYGGMPAHSETAAVMDLSGLGRIAAAPVAGLLPAWRPGLELEVRGGVSVQWRSLGDGTLEEPGGAVVPMKTEDGGLPSVPLYGNGKLLGQAMLDLQYGGVAALPQRALSLSGDDEIMRLDAGNGVVRRFVRVAELRCGLASFQDALCEILEEDEMPRIGLGFLEHVVLRLNFEYGLASLENTGGVPRAGALSGAGLVPLWLSDRFWRVGVLDQSPALETGVQGGDQVISVDREPLEGAAYELADGLLNGGPHERVVRIHRPATGAFVDIVLTPRLLSAGADDR